MAFTPLTTADVLARLSGYPRNLTWVDFRKVAHSLNPPFQALTASGYSTSGFTTRLVDGAYRPVFTGRHIVSVTLNRAATWVLRDRAAQTDDLLRHEQGHFDITGLIARDLCRDLMSIEFDRDVAASLKELGGIKLSGNPSANQLLHAAHNEIQQEIRRAVREANELLSRLQSHRENQVLVDGEYDRQTNHGQNAVGQRKWNDMFRYSRDNDTSLRVTMMVFNA
jgi:hypothetical protein